MESGGQLVAAVVYPHPYWVFCVNPCCPGVTRPLPVAIEALEALSAGDLPNR